MLCCRIRKVEPLRRALSGLDGWITGLRRDQGRPGARSPRSRSTRARRDREGEPGRRLDPGSGLGVHPRAQAPLQRALRSGLHLDRLCSVHAGGRARGRKRAGRWWWENSGFKECGLHEEMPHERFDQELEWIDEATKYGGNRPTTGASRRPRTSGRRAGETGRGQAQARAGPVGARLLRAAEPPGADEARRRRPERPRTHREDLLGQRLTVDPTARPPLAVPLVGALHPAQAGHPRGGYGDRGAGGARRRVLHAPDPDRRRPAHLRAAPRDRVGLGALRPRRRRRRRTSRTSSSTGSGSRTCRGSSRRSSVSG